MEKPFTWLHLLVIRIEVHQELRPLLFSKAGYISFHIDKRGTGISDGNWQLATIPELCEDDLHALEFLTSI